MTLAESEVAGYNKIIRQESRACERMKDKVRRLQYKAVRKTSDIDTTKERRMTYAEWQLRKAEQEEQQAATKVAKAEQCKQEKVLYLGQKVKELDEARLDLAVANSRSAHYPPLEPNNNLDLNIKESRKNKKLRHQKNLH
ncbi:MAG: hypothetical protein JNL72_00295 [Flavipsychrobacter sp.]|nr:hypothetical protein [Flavipsychrobacter sp.]